MTDKTVLLKLAQMRMRVYGIAVNPIMILVSCK